MEMEKQPAVQQPVNPTDARPRARPTLSTTRSPRNRINEKIDAISPDKCNTNFDAVALLRGEMWVFKDNYFWRINKDGGSREDPMELRSFWYGLPSDVNRIDAVYERNDHDIVFFSGKSYYILASNSYLKYGPLSITRLGMPESLDRIDGAVRWGYNDKTYFFSGTMYWRFDEDIRFVELDYPRDIQMWAGVPYNLDAVFQSHNGKTYFFKEKKFWEFNDIRMRVSKDSPQLIGEFWLNCPREMQDPFNRTINSGQQFLSCPQVFILVCLFLIR